MDALLQYASEIRLAAFVLGALGFGLLGFVYPYRLVQRKRDMSRWLNNFSLTFLSSAMIYIIGPVSLIALATKNPQGSPLVDLAGPLGGVVMEIVLLDLLVYWQHVAFHRIPILWRLHRVHHSDTEFDASTALRFHPLEIYLSFIIKAFVIWLLGLHVLSVIVFEIILNFSAMFNHGNFSLGPRLERINALIVTPAMHRIHHSVYEQEQKSNYGFFLSIWDRLFKTYRSSSVYDLRLGQVGMPIFRHSKDQSLGRLLLQPFRVTGYLDAFKDQS